MRTTFLLFVFILFLSSCKEEEKSFVCELEELTPCGADSSKINLRISNVSQYDYCNVEVYSNGLFKNYGEILSGDTSCYINYNSLYRSAGMIRLLIRGKPVPIEAGEYIPGSFNPGFYICTIDIEVYNDSTGFMHQEITTE